MNQIRIVRLTAADPELARRMFELMAHVFDEPSEPLSDMYLSKLLRRPDFWALAAFSDGELIAGLTAHTLPMTRSESSEIMVYDIAVHPARRRQDVGRQLISSLRSAASAAGIEDIFVPADNNDIQALDFYRALGGSPLAVTHFTFSRETSR
ncbi:GNAT family N-acetyltransferase [Steroidobacter sp. S1-65]|uniref:GNAT family N-acetyltransferase n=1 Tax=Steroidobacter gossypii TaxID=2805490 RepID=A0ABS1WQU2_9GAMM|nr:GNAT family N-acetyltransferase [Steroidobacter gossypii]MBM0103350.1 GNAT family N-acetyltransferase [Steroidobacter gossypii]